MGPARSRVDPGDVPADAGHLSGGHAGNVVQAAGVGREPGGPRRRAGDWAAELDDGLDRGGRVAGEVAVQRFGDDAGRSAGGQRGGVDAAPGDPQERGAEAEEHHHDRDRVEQRAAHDPVRQPIPAAAGLGAGRALHGAADPQRVHLRAQDGQQRGQHGQGGDHVDQHGGHPAVADGPQDRLGEQHQAGQHDRDRDPGDQDRPAGGGHGAGDRVLDRALLMQFLAEPGDQEQPVVDAQAQAEDGGDIRENIDTPVTRVSSRSAVNEPRMPRAPITRGRLAAVRPPKITSRGSAGSGRTAPRPG